MQNLVLKTSLQYITMNSLQSQKERSDMILEPLQVMIQLGLLSFCPTGTKVSVSDNLLHLQQPSYVQGVVRWWQSDNKDDLYYLFHAIRRYYKWYKPQNNKVYNHILTLAIKGISKLTETYSKTDKTSITHTLNLYKNVLGLENPDLFKNTEESSVNIDNVFEKITSIYDERLLRAVFNTFKLMQDEKNENNIQWYLQAIQYTLSPTNILLRKWIHENLTC